MKQETVEDTLPINESIISTEIESKVEIDVKSGEGIENEEIKEEILYETKEPHPDSYSPTLSPPSTTNHTARIPPKPPPHFLNQKKMIQEVDSKCLWENCSYYLVP